MRILYVMPHPNAKRNFFSRFTYPSLTLKQLAAITPPEHNIEIIDERYEKINFNKPYDAVGISCLTYNSLRGYEVAKEFQKRNIPVFMGGYHASLMIDEAQQYVDSVIYGEAELTLPRLLKDIENDSLKPIYKAERLVDPEEIPAARHDIGSYNPITEPIQASRGCPTGCEFCAMQIVEGPRFRGRPVDHMIEEMKSIKQKSIFFADASLTISPPYSKSLFKGMAELNKQFECFGNVNVLDRDDEFLNLAQEAGIIKWYLGIESLSQENINAAGKSTNKVENYGKAIQKIKDYNMMVCGFFMFGFDFDTPDSFDKTLDAIYKWNLDEVSFSIVTPYPGTRLFDRFEREGRITCRDWSQYEEGKLNYKLENMTKEELLDGMKRVALDFYSIPKIFKRSFRNNSYPTQFFSKLIRNFGARNFYLHEKLSS